MSEASYPFLVSCCISVIEIFADMWSPNSACNFPTFSALPSDLANHISLAPLLTQYSILVTRLDELMNVVQMRMQPADDDDMPYSVLEKMQNDLTSARMKYVEAVRYWKERHKGGREGCETLDESFERVVRLEMEECAE